MSDGRQSLDDMVRQAAEVMTIVDGDDLAGQILKRVDSGTPTPYRAALDMP